jgi:hypothetical protein
VAQLKDKLENGLNEARILMLGIQVLIGFDYRAIFEEKFAQLPTVMQHLKLASLSLLIVSLTLIFAPITFHWVRGRGEYNRELHSYTQKMIEWGLLPFAVAMAMDLTVAASRIVSQAWSYGLGTAILLVALGSWYAFEYYRREGRNMNKPKTAQEHLELKDKIKQVLIETRIALPGVQATLGFQFIIVLANGFDSLPSSLRVIHLASLLCSAICAILLIAPAAYHRIVLAGENSEELVRFASRMLLASLVPLALALSGDVTVVVWKVTRSMQLAIAWASGALVMMLGFWFLYMLWRREAHARVLQIAPHGINARLDNLQRSGK